MLATFRSCNYIDISKHGLRCVSSLGVRNMLQNQLLKPAGRPKAKCSSYSSLGLLQAIRRIIFLTLINLKMINFTTIVCRSTEVKHPIKYCGLYFLSYPSIREFLQYPLNLIGCLLKWASYV